jgi:hypothetical protein
MKTIPIFNSLKIFIIATLPILLRCSGCTSTGAIQEKESWGAVTFIGDELHYAVVKNYEKYTTGTSPFEPNGEVLEKKAFVYIKNARTGESKKIFETTEQMNDFFPSLQDTAISFTTGRYSANGYVYKYTGELITKFKGSGIIGGWTVPYSKYVTNEKGNELIERDWFADTFLVIANTNYSSAQPWGIINYWGGSGGRCLISNDTLVNYNSGAIEESWINKHQIIGFSAIEVFDNNYVVLYDFSTGKVDTLFLLGTGRKSLATVNSNATILIKNDLEIIDLTSHKYRGK